MERFEFIPKEDAFDGDRSGLANNVCKLLYQKYKDDLDVAIIEGEIFFDGFEAVIRNIYELIDREIPLYAYYELMKPDADNWGFDEEEYKTAISNTIEACRILREKHISLNHPNIQAYDDTYIIRNYPFEWSLFMNGYKFATN